MSPLEAKKNAGLKAIDGKLDWDLLPTGPLREIIKCLTDGNLKYERDNWMLQDGEVMRDYRNAALRHIMAHKDGEIFIPDPKSDMQVRHLAAAATSIMIMLYHEMKATDKDS